LKQFVSSTHEALSLLAPGYALPAVGNSKSFGREIVLGNPL
jgi:hypothetical protein